jgi:hypothetical protein
MKPIIPPSLVCPAVMRISLESRSTASETHEIASTNAGFGHL